MPVVVRSLRVPTARALGIRDGGALLVRPDGLAVGAWAPGVPAHEALATGVASATGRVLEQPRQAALVA